MIISKIKERYPVEYQFRFNSNLYPVFLTFAESICVEKRKKLVDELESCFLTIVSQEQYRAVHLHIESTAKFPAILCLPDGSRCYFPEGNENQALVWAIYACASGAEWKNRLKGRVIKSSVYSAQQQYAALEVLRRVQCQMNSRCPEQKLNRIFKRLEEIPQKYLCGAPCLWDQPIAEGVFSGFGKTGLFGHAQKWAGGEVGRLINYLYGNINIKDQADAYVKLCADGSDYRHRLAEAQNSLLDDFRRIPCNSVINALNHLHSKAEAYGSDSSFAIEGKINEVWNKKIPAVELKADAVKDALTELQGLYEKYILCQIERRFFTDLLSESLENKLKDSRKKAAEEFGKACRELIPFCGIYDSTATADNADNNEVTDWSDVSSVIGLSNAHRTGWDTNDVNVLLNNQNSADNIWLMSEQIFNLMNINEGLAGRGAFSVPVTELYYVWCLNAAPLREGDSL